MKTKAILWYRNKSGEFKGVLICMQNTYRREAVYKVLVGRGVPYFPNVPKVPRSYYIREWCRALRPSSIPSS